MGPLEQLQSVAQELRVSVPEEDARLRGNIVRLHREGNLGAGEVTIAGIVTGDVVEQMRRVSVSLSEPDSERPIRAHETFADVEIVGSLQPRRTRTHLREARDFEVHPPVETS
jgi:hypothetical protein